MSRRISVALLGALLTLSLGCVQKVLVPPRVDLGGFGAIGVIDFTSPGDRELREFATQRFLQSMQHAQAGVPLLELGSEREVLHSVGHKRLDIDAIRAIGEKYRVDTVLTGQLSVTKVKPKIDLRTAVKSLSLKAEIEGMLLVKLQDAGSGATRWTNSARGSKTVARASLIKRGGSRISAGDPKSAEGALVGWLVNQLTHDFRPHYAKR